MKSNIKRTYERRELRRTHSIICLVVTAIVYFVLCLSGWVANRDEHQGWTGVDEELDVRIAPTNEGAAPPWVHLNASIAAVQDELRAIELAEEELGCTSTRVHRTEPAERGTTVVPSRASEPANEEPNFVIDMSMVDDGVFDCGMGMKPLAEVVLATPQPKDYTIRELKAICKANKGAVKGYSNMPKSELLDALTSANLI